QVVPQLLLADPQVSGGVGDSDPGPGQQIGHEVQQPGQPVRRRGATRAGSTHAALPSLGSPATAAANIRGEAWSAISFNRLTTASRTSGGSSTRTWEPYPPSQAANDSGQW